ncbi:hypothetical protein MASR1M8_15880 [Thermomonas brevis]
MTTAFVYNMNGRNGKWSRYELPYPVDAFSQLSGELFIRTGDRIVRVVDGLLTDHVDGVDVPFGGTVWWPYVDWGVPAATKKLGGLDLVAAGKPSVSVLWDQRDNTKATEPYAIDPDTWTGGVIPMPLMAPSFGVKVEFEPGHAWSLTSLTLYLSQTKGQP